MADYYNKKYLKYKSKYMSLKNHHHHHHHHQRGYDGHQRVAQRRGYDILSDDQRGGREDLEEFVKSIYNTIKPILDDTGHPPIELINPIPSTLKYTDKFDIENLNTHAGQRKLLLTEIEFYSKCIGNKKGIVIYAGSASGEHTPIILKLFPNLKFILIDPNYHAIDADYKYIYQNVEAVDQDHKNYIRKLLSSDRSERDRHLRKLITRLETTKFLNNSSYNVLASSRREMNQIKDDFYKSEDLLDIIKKDDSRVFIIQDYLMTDLTLKLKESLKGEDIYFLTDIRTVHEFGGPNDVDILWNGALQIIFLKILQPVYSMLKFRTPFHNEKDIKSFQEYIKKPRDYINEVFDYVKDHYGMDIVGDYLKRQYNYFDGDARVQAWAPKNSSETRMYVSREQINKPFINWDSREFENKMFAFKWIRNYKYYPVFYEILKNVKGNHYDGCQDCAREITILMEYAMGHLSDGEGNNLSEIQKALKKNPKKLYELYDLVNRFTFFDLTNNFKFKHHGYLTKELDPLTFIYFTSGSSDDANVKPDLYEVNRETGVVTVREKAGEPRPFMGKRQYHHKI